MRNAAITAAIGCLLLVSSLGDRLMYLSYELPFLLRPNIKIDETVLVLMDEPSHRALGQPYDAGWNRALHADLVDRLREYGAKAIAFDILFEDPSVPEADEQFLQAMERHGRVLLATKETPKKLEGGSYLWIVSPIYSNFTKAASWGVAEASGMDDRIIRTHFRGASGEPSLAWRIAEATMVHPPEREPARARWVNYYGPPLHLPNVSYYQVTSNLLNDPVSLFSNRVVFVGAHTDIGHSGGIRADLFRTPYSRATKELSPGVEIVATTYLNLARADFLTQMAWPAQAGIAIVFAAALAFLLPRFSPWNAVAITVVSALLVAVVAMVLTFQQKVWFSWLILSGVQAPCALGCWLLAHVKRLNTDRELLQQVIVAREMEALGGGSAPGIPRPAELYSPIMPGPATSMTAVIHSPEGVLPPIPDHILCRQIGRGAYGHVWLARDAIGTFHAVKIIYRNQFHDGGPFEREFRGIQKFTPISREHPGFVHILHVGRNDEGGYFYYIMELGDDESTGQKIDPENYKPKTLASERAQQGKLLVDQCIQLGLSLASALHHLHGHQLIHRDIKPANIIFVNNKPKFADIGLVTEMAATGEEISYVGTKGYAAPEGPGTPAADIYGLGKVLYEVITGLDRSHFPDLPTGFVADPNPALFPLNDIILKACDPDPAKRYTSAAVLHGDLLTLWQSVESAARVR